MKEEWTYKKLGEVATFVADGDWIESKDQSESGIRLVQTGNVGNGIFKSKDEKPHYISEETMQRLGCTEIFEGDCLVSRLPDPVGRACIIPNIGCRMITAVDCSIIRFGNDYLPQFFVNYSQSSKYRDCINNNTTGTTRKRISRKNLEKIPIPIPPLSVQQSIVSELDMLSGLIAKHEEQLKAYDELAQSIFYDMFGDPVENEKGWEVKKLGECCKDVKYGTSRPACEQGKYKYLRMCNITNNGFLDLTDLKLIDIPDDEVEKYIVRRGDILFNRTNSVELIGKTCMFDSDEPMIIAGYIIRIRLSEFLEPNYLSRMFNLPSIKNKLRSMAKGAVHQANINSKELSLIQIPLPPLSLQALFAEKIEAIERQKERIRQSMAEVKTLFDSRMDYYFNSDTPLL